MNDNELPDTAQIIQFPFAPEPTNLRCHCGGEWWDACVVFMEEEDLLHVAGWYGVIKCHDCGLERNLNSD